MMKILAIINVVLLITRGSTASARDEPPARRYENVHKGGIDVDLDAWINAQVNRSWTEVKKNISPSNSVPGIIVASLSTSKPDYYYSWTRDAAIVEKEIVTRYEETQDARLLELIKTTIAATKVIQGASMGSNASLGEPKFYVNNGTAYQGPWGRPQRDGPALRATVYIKFAQIYSRLGGSHYVQEHLYDGKFNSKSVIKADLDYICDTWYKKSYDLWEEVNGDHFYTYAVILRALKEGSKFAEDMRDERSSKRYQEETTKIENRLRYFWDEKSNYIRISKNVVDPHGKISGLDVGTLLGSLHAGREMPGFLRPESTMMMKTFDAILQSMSNTYPLNKKYKNLIAKAIGRYPEDIYDGVGTSVGNPWFICTLTMAEYLYRLDSHGIKYKNITQGFGEERISTRLIGDEFVKIVRNSVLTNGSIHEQFDRVNGVGLGARDLTWSHVSFLSMYRARNQLPEF